MDEGYLVEFYKNNKKVYERVCKSSNKNNAINTALRNIPYHIDFTTLEIYKLKLSYVKVEE